MHSLSQRTQLHYLVAMALFALYGVQVCPFLDSLSTSALLIPILFSFISLGACRAYLDRWLKSVPLKKQIRLQFNTDLSLFTLSGICLGLYFSLSYQFPLESAGKVLLGMIIFGFFIACELALFSEYKMAQELVARGEHLQPDSLPYPLTRKFSWFATLCALSVIGVVFLVINKDLEWLIHSAGETPLPTAQRYILTEIIFIISIMMAYVLAIILGYSRNLGLFIHAENQTLTMATAGELQHRVPVTSNDEFGLIAQHTNLMISSLQQQQQEIKITRDATIMGLASLAETRDNETGGHILRTQNYVKALAEKIREQEKYATVLDDYTIELLFKSAPLHDVGKVGIPDSILLKPGKLSDEEFAIMKQHPQIGADSLASAQQSLGENSFLHYASEISLTHHEKWDGSGYPAGLKEEEIPLSGRLMAVADVYDALISKRVYKPAFSHEKAKAIIIEGSGKHFDPTLIEAFIAIEDQFKDIAAQFADSNTH